MVQKSSAKESVTYILTNKKTYTIKVGSCEKNKHFTCPVFILFCPTLYIFAYFGEEDFKRLRRKK